MLLYLLTNDLSDSFSSPLLLNGPSPLDLWLVKIPLKSWDTYKKNRLNWVRYTHVFSYFYIHTRPNGPHNPSQIHTPNLYVVLISNVDTSSTLGDFLKFDFLSSFLVFRERIIVISIPKRNINSH